jgi:hypothetical protein
MVSYQIIKTKKMETTEKNKVEEGQMLLLQATYSAFTWIYRTTKDPDDFKRPPDLLGVLQQIGAKIHGIWYSFGEYDTVAIIEVPNITNVAALIIAMRSGWNGKAFDKVIATPLLNQNDAAIACAHAATGLAKSRDATKDGPLVGKTIDYSNQDFSKGSKDGWSNEGKVPSK